MAEVSLHRSDNDPRGAWAIFCTQLLDSLDSLGAARSWLSWPRCDPDIIVETALTTANGWQYGRQRAGAIGGEATSSQIKDES